MKKNILKERHDIDVLLLAGIYKVILEKVDLQAEDFQLIDSVLRLAEHNHKLTYYLNKVDKLVDRKNYQQLDSEEMTDRSRALAQEYCQILNNPNLTDEETSRLGEILELAEKDSLLQLLLNEAEYLVQNYSEAEEKQAFTETSSEKLVTSKTLDQPRRLRLLPKVSKRQRVQNQRETWNWALKMACSSTLVAGMLGAYIISAQQVENSGARKIVATERLNYGTPKLTVEFHSFTSFHAKRLWSFESDTSVNEERFFFYWESPATEVAGLDSYAFQARNNFVIPEDSKTNSLENLKYPFLKSNSASNDLYNSGKLAVSLMGDIENLSLNQNKFSDQSTLFSDTTICQNNSSEYCPDIVSLSNLFDVNSVDANGSKYLMEIHGFQQLGITTTSFLTLERQPNEAELMARLTPQNENIFKNTKTKIIMLITTSLLAMTYWRKLN